ncbi:hypothetical protein DBR46_06050 [Pseudomonas sp. KBW05]|nr:hypothetical protein DBR46_06050 [Pseudomonas sp. KBW05]
MLSRSAQIKCGSGLARESGLSVNASVADPPYSRASPLPQKPAPTSPYLIIGRLRPCSLAQSMAIW